MQLDQNKLKAAAGEASAFMSTLNVWAKKQAAGIIKQIEAQRRPETLSLHWPKIKQGWLGGFISGVPAGFDLGYRTANKQAEALDDSHAVLTGTEREVIEAKNSELRKYFGEMIGEASMLWRETPKGAFESDKAVEMVERLMSRFQIPMPPEPQAQADGGLQERLPGL